jgi:hypothetical protein
MKLKMKKESSLIVVVVIIVMAFTRSDNNVRLDGVINEGEWKDAKQYDLSGGGKLMMKKEKNDLYVALVAGKKGWAHVYLSHGDTVRVLHASAALGEARYVKQKDLWRVVQTFKWELRGKEYNDELLKKQQDHYRQFGWVANNNNMGNGMTFEFKLDLSRTDNNPATFACVIAEEPLLLHHFPVSLNDNTILQRLVQGYPPDSLQFNPATWEQVR